MRQKFEELTQRKLWNLRKQVVVNSIYICDYQNNKGFSADSMCSFFEGYYDFLWELAEEDNNGKELTHDKVMGNYDNSENLWRWYCCFDDFSWVEYE